MNSNFIEEYPDSISSQDCLRLIHQFEKSAELHTPGTTTIGYDDSIKKDTEIQITNRMLGDEQWSDVIKPVINALGRNVDAYKKEYTIDCGLEDISRWGLEPPGINFQRFKPGEGYKRWHCEAPCRDSSKRVLVWMIYLNTIDDKGGTDFQYQDFTCKAESGKMVIWPPYWTHFHRSQVSPSSIKYIMTGWFSYV